MVSNGSWQNFVKPTNEDVLEETWLRMGDVCKPTTHFWGSLGVLKTVTKFTKLGRPGKLSVMKRKGKGSERILGWKREVHKIYIYQV
jgi:hypothetical protein